MVVRTIPRKNKAFDFIDMHNHLRCQIECEERIEITAGQGCFVWHHLLISSLHTRIHRIRAIELGKWRISRVRSIGAISSGWEITTRFSCHKLYHERCVGGRVDWWWRRRRSIAHCCDRDGASIDFMHSTSIEWFVFRKSVNNQSFSTTNPTTPTSDDLGKRPTDVFAVAIAWRMKCSKHCRWWRNCRSAGRNCGRLRASASGCQPYRYYRPGWSRQRVFRRG